MAPDEISYLAAVTLFLLTLHKGAALKCYQSTCLDADVASCEQDARVELRDCTAHALRRVLGGRLSSAAAAGRMTCVTHGARALLPGEEGDGWKELVLRMCFVDLPGLCGLLENFTNSAFRAEGNPGHAACDACSEDGCNPASRPRAAPALLAAVVGTLLART